MLTDAPNTVPGAVLLSDRGGAQVLVDGARRRARRSRALPVIERVDANQLMTVGNAAERRWTRGPWTDGWRSAALGTRPPGQRGRDAGFLPVPGRFDVLVDSVGSG